jgi:DNA-directed RNA polymerase specialized sigma24 family protein
VDGERVSAIAARLGEPAERVRKRKSRALERLRQELGGGHKTSVTPTVET